MIAIEFEQEDEDGRLATGTLEKTFAGAKGTVRLEYDGQAVTDPTLADQVLAELTGHPDARRSSARRASVRHHELERPRPRRGGAARPAPGVDQRRRPGHAAGPRSKLERALYDLTTKGDKNPGRLKVAEERRRRDRALRSSRAKPPSPSWSATATRCPAPASDAPRPTRPSPSAAALLEKARQAERLDAERTAAQERYERYRAGGRGRRRSSTSSPRPTRRRTRCPCSARASSACGSSTAEIRELRAALAGEVDVQFEVAPGARPGGRSRGSGRSLARRRRPRRRSAPFALGTLGILDLGRPGRRSAPSSPAIGLILAFVALWLRRGSTGCRSEMRDVEIDRRLRGRSEMEAELRQAEADTEQQLGSLGLDRPGRGRGPARPRGGPRRPDRPADRPARRARRQGAARDAAGRCATRPRSRSSRRRAPSRRSGPIAKEPRARERLEVEVRDQEAALERARDDEANARARVEANAVDAEQVAGQAERLAGWREQLAALQRRAARLRDDAPARSRGPSRRR